MPEPGAWIATTEAWWARVRYPIVAFAIWYADGSVFIGPPHNWPNAPAEGVQVLVVYHPPGSPTERVIISGKDEYALPGQPGSKLGLLIDEQAFYAIQARALHDQWRP